MTDKLTLYTDGACRPNPGPGGWAYYCPELNLEGSGGLKQTTNNEAEMTAVLFGIGAMPDGARVKIVTDSKMVIGWVAQRWKIESNPKIREIRDAIDNLMVAKSLVLSMQLVKGHDGNKGNERVDRLAVAAIGTHVDPQVFQWVQMNLTLSNVDLVIAKEILKLVEKAGGEITGGEVIVYDSEWSEVSRKEIIDGVME